MKRTEQGGKIANRNAQVDLPTSDPVHIYFHLSSGTFFPFHPDFGLTVTACESSEASNGNVSFEVVNLFNDFEDLPRLKDFIFTLSRSGITETVVTVTASLQGGSSICRPGGNVEIGRRREVSGNNVFKAQCTLFPR